MKVCLPKNYLLESLAAHYFFGILFVFEDNEAEAPGFLALSVLDNVCYLSRSDLSLEKFLKFGTIDVGGEPADKKLSLLQLFSVLGKAVLLQLRLTFDHAVLEYVVWERDDRVVCLLV